MRLKHFFFLTICLSITVSSFSQTFNQFLKAGNKAFDRAEYYTAITYFEKASAFQKKSDEVFYKIGLSYLELKDYNNSLKNFSKVKEKSAYTYLNYKIGENFMLIGDYSRAIRFFESFKTNYREKDYFLENSIQKIASCYWAKDNVEINEDIIIESIGKNVNTEFSEFSAGYFKDSLLQVTSFFQDEEERKAPYKSDIFFYEKIRDDWNKKETNVFKDDKSELANGFYLSEKDRYYFNRCEKSMNGKKRCDLFVSEFKNGKWSEEIKLNINDKIFTTTQASVYVNEEGKDVVYFISDRENGIGQNDIWTATETELGKFKTPVVLSDKINSIGNEASPFFDKESNTLYFSSEWHYGYGGYDIFKTNLKTQAENIGLPYNSSANDLYYKVNENNEGFFSSNREGALRLKGAACCYDVFLFEDDIETIVFKEDSISKIDSLIVVHKEDSVNILLDKIIEMLPVTVYFHNDEPNPKTEDTITTLSYSDAYKSFTSLKDEYYQQNSFDEIDAFFYDNLEKGFINLKAFEKLLADISPNHKIKLEIKGYCSPLAENDYNIKLSKRRISSLKNYISSNKVLAEAMKANRFQIIEIPFGEEKSADDVSDDYNNTKLSIYNPKAALERKVAIIGVLID